MQKLEEELIAVSNIEVAGTAGFSEARSFQSDISSLMDHFQEVFNYRLVFVILSCLFPICLIARLFKAFSAQPRLAIVTRTLSVAAVDVAHFLIVFMAIFTTFTVMGMITFG